MVKRYHESFPSFSYGFDSRYPLHFFEIKNNNLSAESANGNVLNVGKTGNVWGRFGAGVPEKSPDFQLSNNGLARV